MSRQKYNQRLTKDDEQFQALPINRADFILMWKTLLLKLSQDVYEQEKHQRAPNFVRLVRNVLLPAPLADLFSIGQHHSAARGYIYNVVPPVKPNEPPAWWEIDAQILIHFQTAIHCMKSLYMMKEYPLMSDNEYKPLIHS